MPPLDINDIGLVGSREAATRFVKQADIGSQAWVKLGIGGRVFIIRADYFTKRHCWGFRASPPAASHKGRFLLDRAQRGNLTPLPPSASPSAPLASRECTTAREPGFWRGGVQSHSKDDREWTTHPFTLGKTVAQVRELKRNICSVFCDEEGIGHLAGCNLKEVRRFSRCSGGVPAV